MSRAADPNDGDSIMEQAGVLFDAIIKGDASAVEAMLTKEPKLAGAQNDKGISAVLVALYNQQREIADRLLQAAPALDIFDAAATGQLERLRTLLDDDATLANAEASDGARPLHLACFFGQTEAARVLLDNNADVDVAVAAFGGVFPIHSAAASQSIEIIKLLLEAGADPNTKQQGGWTALHAAAKHGNTAMTQLLLDNGADPNMRNDDGATPRDLLSADSPKAIRDLLNASSIS